MKLKRNYLILIKKRVYLYDTPLHGVIFCTLRTVFQMFTPVLSQATSSPCLLLSVDVARTDSSYLTAVYHQTIDYYIYNVHIIVHDQLDILCHDANLKHDDANFKHFPSAPLSRFYDLSDGRD